MTRQETDIFSNITAGEEKRRIYSVSEITQDIKLILERSFGDIFVEGEISNFRPAASGHFYFSLKDKTSLLSAAMFVRANKDLKFALEDGLKVICFGKIEVYGPRGQYQIIVEKIEPKGVGGLQLALEQLKQRLEKEGLFSSEHKKPVPYLPKNIGLVTSLHGAAIKDIFKVLDTRFKDVHIIIKSVTVQGEGAKEEISRAINEFNDYNQQVKPTERIDVMIVGRGGGSIEDLWAFNEEIVARSIYNSRIPVISAVGHERDWTIADLTADLRAPTPSAAAELVIPKKEDLSKEVEGLTQDIKRAFFDLSSAFEESMNNLTHRLKVNVTHIWELDAGDIDALRKKLCLLDPSAVIVQHKDRIIDLARQIRIRIEHFIKLRQLEFIKSAQKLTNLNPLNILGRGYSVTFNMPEGKIVKDVKTINIGDVIKTVLHKGELISKITDIKNGSEIANDGKTEGIDG